MQEPTFPTEGIVTLLS